MEANSDLRYQTSSGGLRRKGKRPHIPKSEWAAHDAAMRSAQAKADAGDESEIRALTDVRWCVECLVSAGGMHAPRNTPHGRRRKYSNPLFLTPGGLINSYPEEDGDLFLSQDAALSALRLQVRSGHWEIRETLLEMELTNKRYVRWEAEVKDQPHQEAKRTFEEVAAIYRAGGRAALRKLYTREHVAKLMAKLRGAGIAVEPTENGFYSWS